MASNDSRTKRIFVSDLHIGDAVSHDPNEHLHPWAWLGKERADMFGRFLEVISSDPQVKEVIILGDLFDVWIYPTELDPVGSPTQFHTIASAPQNAEAMRRLREIANGDEIDLIYVTGNHDMLMTKDIVEDIIPGIRFLGEPDHPGQGVFEADGIAAEHGSYDCLFNAPDWYTQPGHTLPGGFFISRAAAHRQANTGKPMDFLKMLAEAIESIFDSDDVGKLAYDPVLAGTGPYTENWIKMGGIDNYLEPVQLEAPSQWYAKLSRQWEIHMHEMTKNVPWIIAAYGDMSGDLRYTANLQYFNKPGKSEIVIFGHSHRKCIWGSNRFLEEHEAVKLARKGRPRYAERVYPDSRGPYKYIYANSGTWVNSSETCNFVETQLDQSAGRHYVRLMEYDEPRGNPEIKTEFECFKEA